MRQLSSTMLLLLSGDPMFGAMPARASAADLENCKGEFQIIDKDCSIYLASHSTADAKNNSICRGNVNFSVESAQLYVNIINNEALSLINKHLGVKNSYLVVGVGMHFWLRVVLVIKDFLSVILKMIKDRGNGWPRIIWIELHNIDGFLRIDTKFHNDKIKTFNKEINEYLEKRNITVVRTYEISKKLKSYDGQHYGVGFNLFKINLVLNTLSRLVEIS